MKKITFLALGLAVLFITSCGNDDNGGDEPLTTEQQLQGTWVGVDYDVDASATGTVNGIPVTPILDAEVTNLNHSITFNENPNKVTESGEFDVEIEASAPLVGEQSFIQEDLTMNIDGSDWELNEDGTLNISQNGQGLDAEIIALNENTLILEVTQERQQETPIATFDVTIETRATFERQ